MYRSILVPLDGSTFGEHALPLAVSIARRAGATLNLVHVHAPLKSVYLEGAAFLDDSLEADIKAQQQDYLQGVAGRVQSIAPGLAVATKLVVGDVASSLASEAVNQGANLVVMTTHGRGPLGRFWLGSVADQLIGHLPMPLLRIRPHEATVDLNREPPIRHILISLDSTPFAEKILEPAVELGRLMEADVTLVRIIKPVIPADYPVEVSTATQAVQAVLQRVENIQTRLQEEARK